MLRWRCCCRWSSLADLTSRFTLVLFAIVNLALIRIKAREAAPPRHVYLAPRWVPWAGLRELCGVPACRSRRMLGAISG